MVIVSKKNESYEDINNKFKKYIQKKVIQKGINIFTKNELKVFKKSKLLQTYIDNHTLVQFDEFPKYYYFLRPTQMSGYENNKSLLFKQLFIELLMFKCNETYGDNWFFDGNIALYIHLNSLINFQNQEIHIQAKGGKRTLNIGNYIIKIKNNDNIKFVNKRTLCSRTSLLLPVQPVEETLFSLFSAKQKVNISLNSYINQFLTQSHFNIYDIQLITKNRKEYKTTLQRLFTYVRKNNIKNHSLEVIFENYGFDSLTKEILTQNNMPEYYYSLKRFTNFIDSIFNISQEMSKNDEVISFIQKNILEKSNIPNGDIKLFIKEHLSKETYHSITIEGYVITEDYVNFVINNIYPEKIKTEEQKNEYEKQIKNREIISSYLKTVEYIVDEIITKNISPLNLDIVKNINFLTFKDSLQKNNPKTTIKTHDFRNSLVYMNGSEGYLPSSNKMEIIETLEYVFKKAKEIAHPFFRAVFVHFCVVPIQPFQDGNGRLSRFLMNIILTQNNYQWLIIKDNTYRLTYLSSWNHIHQATLGQLEKQYVDFIEFILKSFVDQIEDDKIEKDIKSNEKYLKTKPLQITNFLKNRE